MSLRLDRVGSQVVGRLMDARVLGSDAGIAILMYHSVSGDAEPGVSPYYRLATTPQRFAAQMRWLQDNGYSVVDLESALSSLANNTAHERLAVITFDDGFLDFRTNAWPILAAHGFTASVFLPTAFIGDTRRSFKGRECLTWSEVRELHGHGVRFGSHTVTHPKLYELPWQAVRGELVDSRATLENELGSRVGTFAYPYAFPQEDVAFVRRLEEELASAGYDAGVTTVIGRATTTNERLRLKRLPVNDCDDESLFSWKMNGAYDWMGGMQSGFRSIRRLRNKAIGVGRE